jgi:hypothetical protein
MYKPEQMMVAGIGVLVLLVAVYLIWPYLIAFLAIVGAFQVYRFWREHRH